MNPNLADAELKTDEQLEGDVRSRFGELFRKMQRGEPGWLAINLSGDGFESIIREAMDVRFVNQNTCHYRLPQFVVDRIYKETR